MFTYIKGRKGSIFTVDYPDTPTLKITKFLHEHEKAETNGLWFSVDTTATTSPNDSAVIEHSGFFVTGTPHKLSDRLK